MGGIRAIEDRNAALKRSAGWLLPFYQTVISRRHLMPPTQKSPQRQVHRCSMTFAAMRSTRSRSCPIASSTAARSRSASHFIVANTRPMTHLGLSIASVRGTTPTDPALAIRLGPRTARILKGRFRTNDSHDKLKLDRWSIFSNPECSCKRSP